MLLHFHSIWLLFSRSFLWQNARFLWLFNQGMSAANGQHWFIPLHRPNWSADDYYNDDDATKRRRRSFCPLGNYDKLVHFTVRTICVMFCLRCIWKCVLCTMLIIPPRAMLMIRMGIGKGIIMGYCEAKKECDERRWKPLARNRRR